MSAQGFWKFERLPDPFKRILPGDSASVTLIDGRLQCGKLRLILFPAFRPALRCVNYFFASRHDWFSLK
jgi:hypothetical protein